MSSNVTRRESQCWRLGTSLRVSLFIALLSILAPTWAAAEEKKESFSRSGFYVGVSGIYTHNFFDDQIDDAFSDLIDVGIDADVDVKIDDSGGINARVGYRAASWIALEIQYEWVDSFETEVTVSATNPVPFSEKATIDISGHSLTLNTKLIIPTSRIQPYVLLGAGYSLYDADVSIPAILGGALDTDEIDGGKESGFAARGGLGIDWYLTRSIVMSTEVTLLVTTQDFSAPDTGSIDNLYYLSMGVGLQYRF
jgi:opacity protein-like surface antigen